MSTAHDDMLFNMLKECKTLPAFLDEIFGFLSRRTDFYHIAPNPDSPVGLPKGLAESLVRHSFLKWTPKENLDEPQILQESEVPQVVSEEFLIEEDAGQAATVTANMEEISISEPAEKLIDFSESESYNGGVYDDYCWSQSIKEVDVTIKLPPDVSAKHIKVTILPQSLMVKVKDKIVLQGDLCQKCKSTDAIWSLDQMKLQIHLDKCNEIWWDCLVTSEPKLDVSKLDCSRPFEDLPEEAQVKIEELGWNQERKRDSPSQTISDIAIKHENNQMEDDDENLTIDNVQKPTQIIGVRLSKTPKSSAKRGREFRARKALLKKQSKQQQEPDAIVEIATKDIRSAGPSKDNQVLGPSEIRIIEKRKKSAEATRRWRYKKKGVSELSKKQAKTAAQRMREYRERKKLAKKTRLKQRSDEDLDTLGSTSLSQINQEAGSSKINIRSAEVTRRGNSQSQQQIETSERTSTIVMNRILLS
ncbi:nudC domain-containing protein 3 isoform X2 [Anthonomus grandis grandis]|uniref:nudC domain-containing protein 3 isoform X2 n=1 Tax=Anthonomus grandis grandis TaxID=2921223 RepID=UPI00216672C7|nr:nudC domain-containing protein 3 isoform X2 [Anthonomus grandis grandis]